MSTDTVPNETDHYLQTYLMVYQTASQETVTKWHRKPVEATNKRQLPNCFEWREEELGMIGSSTYRRYQLGGLLKGFPNSILNNQPGDIHDS